MALVSTQLLTEISARNLPGSKRWLAREADNLTAICEPIVRDSFTFISRSYAVEWSFGKDIKRNIHDVTELLSQRGGTEEIREK
jgi:hypothetical protein